VPVVMVTPAAARAGDGAPADEGTTASIGRVETTITTEGDVSQRHADTENPVAPEEGVPWPTEAAIHAEVLELWFESHVLGRTVIEYFFVRLNNLYFRKLWIWPAQAPQLDGHAQASQPDCGLERFYLKIFARSVSPCDGLGPATFFVASARRILVLWLHSIF
jgi:hypothetical protein